jgi:hypothetical protein
MRRIRRIALAVAASILLGVGGVTALAATAHADTELTCQGNYTAPAAMCTIKVTLTAPTYITLKISWAPQASWITGGAGWSGSCTLDGQTTAIPETGANDTSPLTVGVKLPYTDPASCTVTVTAAVSGNPSYSEPNIVYLSLLTDGTQPAPAPSPSSSASAVQLVRGLDGTCLRDTGDSAAPRTKIAIWKCNPTGPAQGWTYKGDELKIHGDMCVNAKGTATSGSKVILWPCNGSPNEIWVHKSNGEYVLKANHGKLCLDDPAYSTTNGTQLIVYTCSDTRNQRWTLP